MMSRRKAVGLLGSASAAAWFAAQTALNSFFVPSAYSAAGKKSGFVQLTSS